MRENRSYKKGILALILLALIFASMGIFARYLSTDFTILQQTYLRIFAAFVLGLILFYKDLHFRKIKLITKKEWLVLLFRSISLYVIAVTFISYAFTVTKYSNASFISAVPLTSALGFILLKEKVSTKKILYLLLGLAGVVLIAINDYAHLFSWGKGDLFALISSLFFGLSYVARKWHSNLLNNKEITVMIFFISTILLFATSLLFRESLPQLQTVPTIALPIILLAGLFNVANLFLTNYGFKHVDAVTAGNILTLETLFAVLLGFAFYGEVPLLKEWFGGILIVFSVYQMNKLKD
jgi:drug/metabolite transporter (DMT)-like permease